MVKPEDIVAKILTTSTPVRWKAKVMRCPACGRTVLTTERLTPGGGSQTVFVAHSQDEPTGWSIRSLTTPYETCERSGRDAGP